MNHFFTVLTLFLVSSISSSVFAQPLKIYTELSPPTQFLDKNGKLTGLAIEMVQGIQKRIDNKDPIKIVPWGRSYREVQSKPNVLLFSMARTKKRNPLFHWIGPLIETTYGLYAKANSKLDVRNLDDAKKLDSIGVYRNDVRDLYFTKLGFTNLERVTSNEHNINKLMAGRLDAFACASDGIADLVKSAGFKPTDVKEIFSFLRVQLFIAVSKSTPKSTVTAWLKAFDTMKKDGTYKKIYRKYLPSLPLPGPAITNFD